MNLRTRIKEWIAADWSDRRYLIRLVWIAVRITLILLFARAGQDFFYQEF